jgi:hypothetical protein
MQGGPNGKSAITYRKSYEFQFRKNKGNGEQVIELFCKGNL